MSKKEEQGDLEFELSAFQKDALNELGYRASHHAVTSLAAMAGVKINIDVPTVDVVPIEDAKKLIDAEKRVAGLLLQLDGGFSGYLQVLFPERSAFSLVDILMGKMPGETKSIETEMEVSALTETGNILASSFCDAIADFLKFSLLPSPPSFAFDMAGAVVENVITAVAQAQAQVTTERIILFKCDFKEEPSEGIYGYIMLFPHHESLKNLLSSLDAKVK
ncbi:MAG: chemotaxis protein CheC [Euryarchaeota archaeon]|nr:chemotaxis protein CheC [Euryarchaeota archaeon]